MYQRSQSTEVGVPGLAPKSPNPSGWVSIRRPHRVCQPLLSSWVPLSWALLSLSGQGCLHWALQLLGPDKLPFLGPMVLSWRGEQRDWVLELKSIQTLASSMRLPSSTQSPRQLCLCWFPTHSALVGTGHFFWLPCLHFPSQIALRFPCEKKCLSLLWDWLSGWCRAENWWIFPVHILWWASHYQRSWIPAGNKGILGQASSILRRCCHRVFSSVRNSAAPTVGELQESLWFAHSQA